VAELWKKCRKNQSYGTTGILADAEIGQDKDIAGVVLFDEIWK
jgi:hypothetical protein